MTDKRYFVIRLDDDEEGGRAWVKKELMNGFLRQGWGAKGMQLTENSKLLENACWKERYRKASKVAWDYKPTDKDADTRYRILSIMTEITKGSIVLIPKMPESDMFTIVEAESGYEFDKRANRERQGEENFRHTIPISKKRLEFSYSSNAQTELIHKKITGYQSAVNNIWDEAFINAIDTLTKNGKGDNSAKQIETIFQEEFKEGSAS